MTEFDCFERNKDLEELIQTATRLCNRLDRMAEDERLFSQEVCHFLALTSQEMYKLSENLEAIKG